MATQKANFPVIKCLPRPDFLGGMMFWCPFCRTWHYHGRGNGHRVSHCRGENTPFTQSGYKIRMMSKKELRKIRQAIDHYLEYSKR